MGNEQVSLAIDLFSETAGDEGICGIKIRRADGAVEQARLQVNLESHTQRVLYWYFAHDRKLYEFETSMLAIGALRAGDIAIDVGAHVGYYTLLFRLLVGPTGSIYAFEPMPETYRRLVRNVMRNGFTNILPLPMALADREGTARLHFHPENEGQSTLIGDVGGQSCEVQLSRLDDVFHGALPARPRLLKIDAEGAEMFVLNGGQNWIAEQAPDMVICEIFRGALDAAGTSAQEIRNFFAQRDYRCAVINMTGVDMGVTDRGGRFYRYLAPDEPAAPNCRYVFNLMFIRNGSGLYPDECL